MDRLKYHKIEQVFERDIDTKKIVFGKYASPEVEFLQNNKWVFTEKIDGTNICVRWDGYKVSFAGRTENSETPGKLQSKLSQMFSGRENEEVFEQLFRDTPVTLFGEGYGAGIQTGGSYQSEPGFILFDVFINECFLRRSGVDSIAEKLKIPSVPVVFEGTIPEAIEFVKNTPQSIVAKSEQPLEGIVGCPAVPLMTREGKRVIVKIKRRDFV